MTSCERQISSLPVGRMFQRNLHASACVLFPLAAMQEAWVWQSQMGSTWFTRCVCFCPRLGCCQIVSETFPASAPHVRLGEFSEDFNGLGSKRKFLTGCSHSPLALQTQIVRKAELAAGRAQSLLFKTGVWSIVK